MTACRIAAVLTLGAVLASVVPTVCLAALVARDPLPRAITIAKLREGRQRVVVCDDGMRPAHDLNATFEDFSLLQVQGRVTPRDVLAPTNPRVHEVRPGACVALVVALKPHVTIEDGTASSGTLVVTSTAGIVRLPLTFGQTNASPVVPAAGAGATVALRAVRSWFDSPHLIDGGALPLRVASPAGSPAASPALPEEGAALGMLASGTHRIVLRRAMTKPTQDPVDKSVLLLKLDVQGLHGAGDYTGTLNLAPRGSAPVRVSVALTATDTAVKPALVAGLGVLLAFAAQLWIRNWRIRFRWRRRGKALKNAYGDAREEFKLKRIPGVTVEGPSDDAVRRYREDIENAIQRSSNLFTFLDLSSPAYEGVVASFDLAERDAECLSSRDEFGYGLRQRFEALATELKMVLHVINVNGGAANPPKCAQRAGMLMKGTLKVGGALQRVAAIDTQIAYLRRWQTLFKEWRHYDQWRRDLAVVVKRDRSKVSPKDQRRIVRLGGTICRVREGLFAAGDASELEHLGTRAQLTDLGTELMKMRKQYPTTKTTGVPASPSTRTDLLLPNVVDVVEAADPVTVRPAQPVKVLTSVTTLGDVLVVTFSIAVGVLGMLIAFYFGKTFGTTEDYLTAFAAGAGSQILVSGLAETLGMMRQADQSAVVVADPAGAVAVTPAKVAPVDA